MINSFKYRINTFVDSLKPELTRLKYGRLRKRSPKNLLLILKTDAIGDYILFRNFLHDIRRSPTYKQYHIVLCGNVLWKDLALQFDAEAVDDFIWIEPARLDDEKYKEEIIKQLYLLSPTVALYPNYSRTASGDQLITCCGASQKITFAGDCRNMHPHLKSRYDKRYTQFITIKDQLAFEFLRYRDFFSQWLGTEHLQDKPELKIKKAPYFGSDNYIVICPGASAAWRCWSPQKFHELAHHIRQTAATDYTFHICGSAGDSALAKQIIVMQPALPCIDQTGKLNLVQFAQLIAGATLVITNDSGPLHLAAACGVNVLGLSNGNNYARFVPYPKQLQMPVEVVFPHAIHQYTHTSEGIYRMQQQDSPLPINDITVQQAMEGLNILNAIHLKK